MLKRKDFKINLFGLHIPINWKFIIKGDEILTLAKAEDDDLLVI